MRRLIPLNVVFALAIACGCHAPQKAVVQVPPPRVSHEKYEVRVTPAERDEINSLIVALKDPATVMVRDANDPLGYSCREIERLVELGEKAIPALQREYLALKDEERKAAAGMSLRALKEGGDDERAAKFYAIRRVRYAIMQPLLNIKHAWNTRFFEAELCSHFDPASGGFSADEISRGDIAVRQRAAEYVYKNGDQQSIHNLIWALLDEDPGVSRMAETTLRRITGQDFGYAAARTPEEAMDAIDAWWDWYRARLAGNREE